MTKVLVAWDLLLHHLTGVEHVVEDLVDRLDHHEQEEYEAGVDKPDIPDKCCEILENK